VNWNIDAEAFQENCMSHTAQLTLAIQFFRKATSPFICRHRHKQVPVAFRNLYSFAFPVILPLQYFPHP
jgi:hypothetical protein